MNDRVHRCCARHFEVCPLRCRLNVAFVHRKHVADELGLNLSRSTCSDLTVSSEPPRERGCVIDFKEDCRLEKVSNVLIVQYE